MSLNMIYHTRVDQFANFYSDLSFPAIRRDRSWHLHTTE